MADEQKPPRGSLVGSGNSLREGLFGIAFGILYGATSPLVGHPIDTIKTKMQAQKQYQHGGMIHVARQVYRLEGIRGFYRGIIPPLIGSSIYRSVQFAAYGFAYGALRNDESMTTPVRP